MSVDVTSRDSASQPISDRADAIGPYDSDSAGSQELADRTIVPYRSLSPLAVAAFVVGLSSALSFIDLMLVVVPLIGMGLGVAAILQLRARRDELIGDRWARWGLLASTVCLVGSIASFAHEYATEVPPGFDRTSFVQLEPTQKEIEDHAQEAAKKGLAPEQAGALEPATAKELVGQKIFIKGFMHPNSTGDQKANIKEFVLVRDNNQCCFGAQLPKTTDMILVHMVNGAKADYERNVRKLAGTFRIEPIYVEKLGWVLYHLDTEIIK